MKTNEVTSVSETEGRKGGEEQKGNYQISFLIHALQF